MCGGLRGWQCALRNPQAHILSLLRGHPQQPQCQRVWVATFHHPYPHCPRRAAPPSSSLSQRLEWHASTLAATVLAGRGWSSPPSPLLAASHRGLPLLTWHTMATSILTAAMAIAMGIERSNAINRSAPKRMGVCGETVNSFSPKTAALGADRLFLALAPALRGLASSP